MRSKSFLKRKYWEHLKDHAWVRGAHVFTVFYRTAGSTSQEHDCRRVRSANRYSTRDPFSYDCCDDEIVAVVSDAKYLFPIVGTLLAVVLIFLTAICFILTMGHYERRNWEEEGIAAVRGIQEGPERERGELDRGIDRSRGLQHDTVIYENSFFSSNSFR